jgi:hypothetical protein
MYVYSVCVVVYKCVGLLRYILFLIIFFFFFEFFII